MRTRITCKGEGESHTARKLVCVSLWTETRGREGDARGAERRRAVLRILPKTEKIQDENKVDRESPRVEQRALLAAFHLKR